MFRPKKPQRSIFEHQVYLPRDKVEALKQTWAGPYRRQVLPLIDETLFAQFYHPDNGRPNVPVATMVSLCILKEWHNLTDAELLGALEWDIRRQYALDIDLSQADICQKTLHNFRTLISLDKKAGEIFADITRKIIESAGLSVAQQRLDATHIVSNMAHLCRLGLFVRTITGFVSRLAKAHPKMYAALPKMYEKVYIEREGYFADVKSSRARRRLQKCAGHLFDLVDRFRSDKKVSRMHSYKLCIRLLEEQCELLKGDTTRVTLKSPKQISPESLQNPSDPDATYGRKGKGYKAFVTETCTEHNPFQVITDVAVHGAHESDPQQTIPVIEHLEESGNKPEELFADAGFASGDTLVQSRGRDVELTAPMTSGSVPKENKIHPGDFDYCADQHKIVSCLSEHAPESGGITEDGKSVEAIFSGSACSVCPFLEVCPAKRIKDGRYHVCFPRERIAVAERRLEQQEANFKERYKIRSGIEATISAADRVTGLKRVWTRGKDRLSMVVFMKALAINVKRYVQNRLDKARKGINPGLNPLFALLSAMKRPLGGPRSPEADLMLAAA